jgi:branched-chain amino acid aminotransferase
MDEVFLSSSNKEVVPVVRMDELIFSGGKPGQRTRRLMQRFADYTHQYGQKGK